MLFGIGFGIGLVGEQADNLEPMRRAAADQDRRGHAPATSSACFNCTFLSSTAQAVAYAEMQAVECAGVSLAAL
jgi:hypothetical protein